MNSLRAHTTVPVLRRLAKFRYRQLTILFLLGLLVSAPTIGLAQIRASAQAALETSVQAQNARKAYVIQTSNDEAAHLLARSTEVISVSNTTGYASFATYRVRVNIQTTSEARLALGSLVDGRRPSDATEATASRSALRVLGASIGDTMAVTGTRDGVMVRVVGITADPADADDQTVRLVSRELQPKDATLWLSDIDPYSKQEFRPLLDQRVMTYQRVSTLAAEARNRVPAGLTPLRYLPLLLAALLLFALAATFAVLTPAGLADADALKTVGFTAAAAWRRVSALTLGSAILGELVGAAATWQLMYLAREPISGLINQEWTGVSFRAVHLTLLVLATILVGLAPIVSLRVNATRRLTRMLSARSSPPRYRLALTILAAGLAILAGAVFAKVQSPPMQFAEWAPRATLLISLSLPAIIATVTVRTMPKASKALTVGLIRPLVYVTISVSAISTSVVDYSARMTHDSHALESYSLAPQPSGSFLIGQVPDVVADALAIEYKSYGGRKIVKYDLPDERAYSIRVSGPKLVACMREARVADPNNVSELCFPQKTFSPVNTVGLRAGTDDAMQADPGLVESGKVGVLKFVGTTGSTSELEIAPNVSALAILGGNMPGLIVSAHGAFSRRFGLESSGSQLIGLLDFSSLPERQQAQMRASVARLAPTAQVIDGTNESNYDKSRAVASAVAVAGSVLVLLLLACGGGAVLVAHRRTFRTLIDMGASMQMRRTLAIRWILTPLLGIVLAAPLGLTSAQIAGVSEGGSFGWIWLAPVVTGLLTCFALSLLLLKVPDRVSSTGD